MFYKPLGDEKFKPIIYLQFLESYLSLKEPELEKFIYYLSKFLRQIIKYLGEELINLAKLAANNQTSTEQSKKYEQLVKSLTIVSEFLVDLLDLAKGYFIIIKP